MLSYRCALEGPLMAFLVQVAVCLNISRILSNENSECNVNFDLKETEQVDLSYMFTEGELRSLLNGSDSAQFLPGLQALLEPFISLVLIQDLNHKEMNNSSLKLFKLQARSHKKSLKAQFGSLRLGRAYQTEFRVTANPVVKLSGTFILERVVLSFLEYNTTVPDGNYIGYNLAVHSDLEVIYMVAIDSKGTNVGGTLHLELSGSGPMVFTDQTNCDIVGKRKDLNLGRICSSDVLEEVTKWQGVSKKVVQLVKPVLLQAIWCSFRKHIPNLAELTAAYSAMLTK